MINETDPKLIAEVIEICSKDTSARAYYVGRYAELQKELAINQ